MAITQFKAIQGHRYRYQYRELLFKFWTLCILEPPLGGLKVNVLILGLLESA